MFRCGTMAPWQLNEAHETFCFLARYTLRIVFQVSRAWRAFLGLTVCMRRGQLEVKQQCVA